MADATKNDEKPAVVPSAPANQAAPAPTPAGEKPAAKAPETVPYSRFKEVVSQKNEKDNEITELNKRLQALENKPAASTPVEQAVAELRSELSQIKADKTAESMGEFTARFQKEAKDYDVLEPRMLELFRGMSKSRQAAVINDPEAYKDLYYRAKVEALEKGSEGKVQEGKDLAYQSKGLKQALSSTTGAVATDGGVVLNRETIGKLDMSKPADKKFFMDNKATIMRLYAEGKL